MKRKMKFIVLLTALLFTFSCGKGAERYGSEPQYAMFSMAGGYESPKAESMLDENLSDRLFLEEAGEAESISANFIEGHKLVKRADVRIRVENLEAADASISDLLKKYNAYASSTSITENSQYYSLRVPSQFYDLFLADMNGMGRLIHRSESTEDVTIRYYDLEGRLETKKELLRTFQAYLRRANNIEEILKVEARIAELQYEIDGTGQQLRHLANIVDYATIELNLLGPAVTAPNRSVTFGERIKQMFGSFGGFLSSVVVVIIGIVIYGIPILLLVALIFFLFFGRVGLLKKLWQVVKGKR